MKERQFIKLGNSRYEIRDVIVTRGMNPGDDWHEIPVNANVENFPNRFMYDGENVQVKPHVYLSPLKHQIEGDGLDSAEVFVTVDDSGAVMLDVGGTTVEVHDKDSITVTAKEPGTIVVRVVDQRYYGASVTITAI